jgi:hypothetical protein
LGPDKSITTGRNIKSTFDKTSHGLRIRRVLAATFHSKVLEFRQDIGRMISVRFDHTSGSRIGSV